MSRLDKQEEAIFPDVTLEMATEMFLETMLGKMAEAARLGVPFPRVYFPEVEVTHDFKSEAQVLDAEIEEILNEQIS